MADIKKLKKLVSEQLMVQQRLMEVSQEIEEFNEEAAVITAKGLFGELGKLEKMLKGPVYKQFVKVVDEVRALDGYDGGYQKRLGGDCYGLPPSAERSYLIEYLLNTNKLGVDADFWRMLGQISDTIARAGNPFRIEEE